MRKLGKDEMPDWIPEYLENEHTHHGWRRLLHGKAIPVALDVRMGEMGPDGTMIWDFYPGKSVVTRYSLSVLWRDLRNGIHYRYPPCCILSFLWWGFWHGAPGVRYQENHADAPSGGRVPCWMHRIIWRLEGRTDE